MASHLKQLLDSSSVPVPELRQLLKDQGLPSTGNKPELIERLKQAAQDVSHDEDLLLNEGEGEEDEEVDEEELGGNEEILDDHDPLEESPSKEPETSPKAANVKPAVKDQSLQKRIEKFGLVSEEARKASRAARFGLPDSSKKPSDTSAADSKGAPLSDVSPNDFDKLKKRAERFGASVSSVYSKVEEIDKLKKRADRFGSVTSTELSKSEAQDKLAKRKQRFGVLTADGDTKTDASSDDVEAKKRKRAERFGLT